MQEVGSRFGDILEDHTAIIRGAISASSAVVVGTAGESFFATFREPLDGVRAAAVTIQLAGENTKTQ